MDFLILTFINKAVDEYYNLERGRLLITRGDAQDGLARRRETHPDDEGAWPIWIAKSNQELETLESQRTAVKQWLIEQGLPLRSGE